MKFAIDVLRLIYKRLTPLEISKRLNTSPSRISYYIRRLEKLGLIQLDSIEFNKRRYRLTNEGREFLNNALGSISKKVTGSEQLVKCELAFKFPILKGGATLDRFVRENGRRRIPLRNWCKHYFDEGWVSYELTTRSLIVYVPPFYTRNVLEGLLRGLRIAMVVANKVSRESGAVFGFPELLRRPHSFEFPDPVARLLTSQYNASNGRVQVDRSPPSEGEIGFGDPLDAQRYLDFVLNAPQKLDEIYAMVDRLIELNSKIAETIEKFVKAQEEVFSKLLKLFEGFEQAGKRGGEPYYVV